VALAPTVPYGFYPAFVEYPGSVHIELEPFRDTIVDIARSLARHGPKKIYILNTGISTKRALEPARERLAAQGIRLAFTDLHVAGAAAKRAVMRQEGGTHADEIETSMMLYMAPAIVRMSRATKDFHGDRGGILTRDPKAEGTYSPTGAWGDPTLATAEKGREVVEALVRDIVQDIESLCGEPA
jgi:creatinine amidohydrolase